MLLNILYYTGLSKMSIEYIRKSNFSLFDFIIDDSIKKQLVTRKISRIKQDKIIDSIILIENKLTMDLLNDPALPLLPYVSKTSLEKVISVGRYKFFYQILELSQETFNKRANGNVSNIKQVERVMKAIQMYEVDLEGIKQINDLDFIMLLLFTKKEFCITMVKYYCRRQNIDDHLCLNLIDQLVLEKRLIRTGDWLYFPDNIFYKTTATRLNSESFFSNDSNNYIQSRIKLRDWIFSQKEEDSEKLNMRFLGYSFSKIAEKQGVTRQAIRERITRLLAQKEKIHEFYRYQYIFKLIKFEVEDFCYIFDEDKYTFNFLSEIIDTENGKNLCEVIDELQFIGIPDYKVKRVREQIHVRNLKNKEIREKYWVSICNKLLQELGVESISLMDFYNSYQKKDSKISNDGISITSLTTLKRILEKADCIFFNSSVLRFYDYGKVTEEKIMNLSSVFNLSPGIYGFEIIKNQYPSEWSAFNINNGRECYQIIRHFSLEQVLGIKVINHNEFIIGNIDKFDFFTKMIKSWFRRGYPKKEAARLISEKYFLDYRSTLRYLTENFNLYFQ